MSKLTFKLTVQNDAGEVTSYDLGAEALARLAGSLPDNAENSELFHHLAQSPSSDVRTEIAYRDNISEATVELLAHDPAIDVRRRVCGQTPFSEWATTETIVELVNADIDCAKTIAGRISEYSNADANVIAAAIMQHSDPDVRNALASSWGAPKKVIKQLLEDDDAGVRASAKKTLD